MANTKPKRVRRRDRTMLEEIAIQAARLRNGQLRVGPITRPDGSMYPGDVAAAAGPAVLSDDDEQNGKRESSSHVPKKSMR